MDQHTVVGRHVRELLKGTERGRNGEKVWRERENEGRERRTKVGGRKRQRGREIGHKEIEGGRLRLVVFFGSSPISSPIGSSTPTPNTAGSMY